MRRFFLVVTALAFLFVSASISYAGFNVLKKAQDKVERRLDNEIDKSIANLDEFADDSSDDDDSIDIVDPSTDNDDDDDIDL